MLSTNAYAALSATTPLEPFEIERREPGENDVLLDIKYCGICHSDLHQARNEWQNSTYPMVPGHEIVGHVTRVGSAVTNFKVGDTVGIGCFVNSCRQCEPCKRGEEQYCKNTAFTYNSKDGDSTTYGGYSTQITVDQKYLLKVPAGIPLDAAAPLLCAGITTYKPLKFWGAGPGKKVAVVGLGGLGHMAVKIAKAMEAEVTVLSRSESKRPAAVALGADKYVAMNKPEEVASVAEYFDLIVDTVSAEHDIDAVLSLIKIGGTMVLVGVPPEGVKFNAPNLIGKRRVFAGSMIGGIAETQEMLDFCAAHKVAADIELIDIKDVNESFERMERGDVKYRFVIDCATLK
ncbi:MAG: NAD(P)-dependent alcohol dehydrogenase [Cyanobacteria bacterium SZAS TMP-1]|nr:NAD(P)-dependent alcohol dehydrogenase [Cyanobacteria bacterium SZAS TMP-1]